MNDKNKCYSSYLKTVFEPALFQRAVKDIVSILKPLSRKYDAIAFRGMSGSLFAPTVAMMLKKKLILVRKDGDGNHSGMKSEGWKMADRIVIVDDLISSGTTLKNTLENLCEARRQTDDMASVPKVVAIVLYHDCNEYNEGMPSYCLNDFTKDHFRGVPIYSFMYERDYNDETKTKFYANKLVRKLLSSPEPTDGNSWIHVDVEY